MVPYSHYHGLGNAFLVLDCRERMALPTPEDAIRLCDPITGHGVDGLLCIQEGREGAEHHMHILNADGSEAEMCGNGIRCVIKHIVDRWGATASPMTLSTGAGIHHAHWRKGADGAVQEVPVSMGRAKRHPAAIPVLDAPTPARVELSAGGANHTLECVSMGNPHAIRVGSAARELAEELGPLIGSAPRFPEGVNVGFAAVDGPHRINLVVHERGCGITEACGTGACACVVAAIDRGLVECDQDIEVCLPGGSLGVRVDGMSGMIWMTGPAVHVADGHLTLDPRED